MRPICANLTIELANSGSVGALVCVNWLPMQCGLRANKHKIHGNPRAKDVQTSFFLMQFDD